MPTVYNLFFLSRRPFVSNLYEVVSVDINYFFQYGQEVWYKANHKRHSIYIRTVRFQRLTLQLFEHLYFTKIRFCLVDLQGQVQVNFLTKPIIFFICKFKSLILIFALFFNGVVKSSAFCTLLMLFPRVDILELQFDAKM